MSAYPDKTECMAMLQAWEARHKQIDALISSLGALAPAPESPLIEAIWGLFDDYTRAVAMVVGDASEWMNWFAFENDFGERGHPAGCEGGMREIKTLGDLYWLIEQSRDAS